MTRHVIAVSPETRISEIARILATNAISAVPVVEHDGQVVGMVSEGDLLGKKQAAHEQRRDWWLTMLAEGEALNPEFLATLHDPEMTAQDLMSRLVVTVGEDASVAEIAQLLTRYRIKRVPVLRDGKIVGIVSRADLLRALVAGDAAV